jgi:predicted AAA+ superfamily ATPase
MEYFNRYLKIDLPKKQSAFLWGARKTGKSTYLKQSFPEALYYDLLKSDEFLRFLKSPYLLREEILAIEEKADNIIIIDEVQKVPSLLDEIHWLIENTNYRFILCGSSARKLKNQHVNMLGGRAWKYNFYPLVYPELKEFDLLKIFNHGTIPAHYNASNLKKTFKSYIEDYITQEIQAEGIVRNLPAFTRFLDALRFSLNEMVNYSNIARQAGIDAKTVKEYFSILVDTLLGYYIFPYRKRVSRDIIFETPKFYLFDVGLTNALKKVTFIEGLNSEAGKSLEQYIFQEILAYNNYNDLGFDITYWRTKTGLEVDFVLGEAEVAIEVKISKQVHSTEFKALKAFNHEYNPRRSIVVALEPRARKINFDSYSIDILPVKQFLELLWSGEIMR